MSSASNLIRFGGLAAMLGGLLYVALNAIYFVFTHMAALRTLAETLYSVSTLPITAGWR